MPCPTPYANVIIAERFGVLPWQLEQEPLDRVLYYFGILAIEGEMHGALEGLSHEEPLIIEGDD